MLMLFEHDDVGFGFFLWIDFLAASNMYHVLLGIDTTQPTRGDPWPFYFCVNFNSLFLFPHICFFFCFFLFNFSEEVKSILFTTADFRSIFADLPVHFG